MRKQRVGAGIWVETVLSMVTLVAALVTLLWRDWIELVLGADPDAGSGELEWALVSALLLVGLTLAVLARRGWREGAERTASA